MLAYSGDVGAYNQDWTRGLSHDLVDDSPEKPAGDAVSSMCCYQYQTDFLLIGELD